MNEKAIAEAADPSDRVEAMGLIVRIENWEVVTHPWTGKHHLHGEVYGHPRFPDGHTVTTSNLRNLDGDVAVTKSGTVYQLGQRKRQSLSASDLPSAIKEIQCPSM